uniref:Bradykinin-potentiating and C-type natriuretic peptides n=1 Tax=Gloydius blomhoffii TaxID=242054 RepID=BNP_GLOBL|nr:RecName: Full=Bradykinin-potentiating and C-type natriuretic peptides; AltName: Full=Angiotensin-converting enzyme inhibitor; AltName: Full=BPP-CNP homolog; Contains: RecName: Full=Blomhotin; Contains: RecName: Full=Bradykinin-potentiating peptide A; Short=BPP-a; AltName: Full=Potentiator A; Contains: RecName: Full=Leu3-blomhotin; AltName: Full=Potentiator D; Contains: RecName: Full=Bradykinin-potentiating peptide B; Short=BPP-b; AltName: Full=Potentiator B; Contains: RecName: Full=Bradykinin-po
MFVSRLAASGLLLLALMALSLDGKPVQQWSQGRPPGPPIPRLVVQQWSQGLPPGPPIPRLVVQQWSQGLPPGPPIPPLVVQQWSQGLPPRPKIPPLVVQQWSQGLPPRPKIPPLVVQKWDPPPVSPPLLLQPHESPAGGTTALREELSLGPEAASGPAAAGADGGRSGSKAPAALHRLSKSKGASATSASASRPMRDLRTDGKQARQNWARMVNPDHHAVGGCCCGGGGGGARRLKGLVKKGVAKGCFGLKLDRIGTMSGLGC